MYNRGNMGKRRSDSVYKRTTKHILCKNEEASVFHWEYFFLFFSLRAQSCIKDLQSRPYIKIKTYRKAKKAWDCNMKKLCYSLHKVAGAMRKPNVSQRGINKRAGKQSCGFVMVRDQILAGRRKKIVQKRRAPKH